MLTLTNDNCMYQGIDEGAFQWGLSNASEAWEREHKWPQDPAWTESNWPPGGIPELQLYQVGVPTDHHMLTISSHLSTVTSDTCS